MLNQEVIAHVRAITRALYVVTEDEDMFISEFSKRMSKHNKSTWVYNSTFGLRPIVAYTEEWGTLAHTTDNSTALINDALIQIFKDKPPLKDVQEREDSKSKRFFYLFTDPERWLSDPQVVRRFLNLFHQCHQNKAIAKTIIFVSNQQFIPEKLRNYVHVVVDKPPEGQHLQEVVQTTADEMEAGIDSDTFQNFQGLSHFQIEAAMMQSASKTGVTGKREIDPAAISEYKRNQVKRSELVQFVETDAYDFDAVGGAQRFKAWTKKTRACWTEEGQKFGLQPPRGVLLLGVYGCGKSLSAKALAHSWGLPLLQFEMGRVRAPAVGQSEANLYRALRIVESVAPCLVWMDEAEKSLSGSHSSSQSDAGVTSRLLGILSTWTQELKKPVCLVLTANSLKTLPTEMVNRLPERFFFDLPSEADRIDILKIHAKRFSQDISKFNLQALAEKAKNLVGREIEQAVGSAMIESFAKGAAALDEASLSSELENKPRIINTMSDEIKEILDWVGYDKVVGDGVRARLASDRKSEHFRFVLGGVE